MRVIRVLLVLVFASVLGVLATSGASAQDGRDYIGNTPPGGGETVSGSDNVGSGSVETGREGGGTLPITGADIAILVTLAFSAIFLGWVLQRQARRDVVLRT